MSAYTDLSLLDLRGAVEELPAGDSQDTFEAHANEEQSADALCRGLFHSTHTTAQDTALARTRETSRQSPTERTGDDVSHGRDRRLDVGAPDRVRTDRAPSLRSGCRPKNRHVLSRGSGADPPTHRLRYATALLPPTECRLGASQGTRPESADERWSGAPDRVRTDDIQLGKLMGQFASRL